ncbi:integrase catalytic domain-containing protein [Trichonephila clavipes]|nr:integrase catalytic domain-containing protein [Trichonephila clavipes]
MLIGADFAGRLLTGEIKQITENLVAIHTRLGWTLMGESGENTRRCETLLFLHVSDLDISELWRLDTIGIKDLGENQSKRELEEAAKLHFLENVKRDHEGRYMVGKLSDYEEVFNEWENEDIIEKVESHQEIDEEHYLPHRPVFKENSTTKVRPVFDGSAKEKNSPSINDCLEKGATIEFHLKNAPDHYKETAHTLLESFYVDNLVCSVNSKEKLDKLIVESQEILEEGKFELRGWEHNNLDPQTENTVPTERRSVPVLGLKWDLDQDLLSVDIKVHESKNKILTKRKNIIAASCQLVQARSRVAPLKSISIPRLELLACTIGARLARTVKEDLKLPSLLVFYWSDSTNDLYWIKKSENWAVFVSNRVKEIRNLSNPDDWYYVPGSKNPADLPSRGCSVDVLAKSKWWEGPDWLRGPPKDWPIKEIYPDFEIVNAEKRKTVTSATNSETNKFKFFNDVSSFGKIVRIMAYVLRFCNNLKKNRIDPKKGKLEVAELYEAEKVILKEIQLETLAEEKQIKLNTMKGDDGLIRVETRVSCRKDLETFRYPILLPNTHQAVHLELITSLSTDSFILAFRRFIARRGRPTTIYSDNGKNFVGTFNALNSIDWDKIQDFALKIKIQWKFSPPSAPWWGGFWERLVGMLKNVLRKVLGKASLNEEELNTLLCDAESIINSRPITYLSEDPKDLVALTPAMFLQEIREIGVPDFDMIDSKKLERRFIYRVKIRKDLRNRFRNEYLGLLKDYSKVRKEASVKDGDIVLIGDNDVKRINWPMAKIIKSLPGKDGRIRVVEVKTPSGNFIRPIQKLYPLEVNLPEASDFRERIQKDQKNQEISTSRRGRTLRPPKRLEL